MSEVKHSVIEDYRDRISELRSEKEEKTILRLKGDCACAVLDGFIIAMALYVAPPEASIIKWVVSAIMIADVDVVMSNGSIPRIEYFKFMRESNKEIKELKKQIRKLEDKNMSTEMKNEFVNDKKVDDTLKNEIIKDNVMPNQADKVETTKDDSAPTPTAYDEINPEDLLDKTDSTDVEEEHSMHR